MDRELSAALADRVDLLPGKGGSSEEGRSVGLEVKERLGRSRETTATGLPSAGPTTYTFIISLVGTRTVTLLSKRDNILERWTNHARSQDYSKYNPRFPSISSFGEQCLVSRIPMLLVGYIKICKKKLPKSRP